METFFPINVSSKFAICGLPIRLDTYKNCSYSCVYCFANNRKIMEFDKHLQIADIGKTERFLNKVYVEREREPGAHNNFLIELIKNGYTWHCGGMSDPFQPCEKTYKSTENIINLTNKYGIHILFSTKTDNLYGGHFDRNLHSFQFSVTNTANNKQLEPNVPGIDKRLELYKQLKKDGFKVGIRIQPFIPNISSLEIVKMFEDADQFTLEGIKIVPQNNEHKEAVLRATNISRDSFVQMGLLNLKPQIRLEAYKPFIEYFESKNIPYSIADNDLHYLGNNYCCCGDRLVEKSTPINNTFLYHKYGEYCKEQLDDEMFECGLRDCKCKQLFTSNRQEGCETVGQFFDKRFYRKSSPFSPQFSYVQNTT